jgi:hypothetical protein
VNAKRAEERQLSSEIGDGEADAMIDSTAAAEAPSQAAAKPKGSKAAAGNAAKPAAAAAANVSNSTNSKARRRSRMSDGGEERVTAPSQRGSQIGAVAAAAAAVPEVPLLPLGAAAHDDSTDFEETPPSSSRHVRVRGRLACSCVPSQTWRACCKDFVFF